MKNTKILTAGIVLFLGAGYLLYAEAAKEGNKPSKRQQPENTISVSQKKADKKPDQDLQLRQFMRLKLQASNQIREGLVTENFKKISDGAAQLGKMSAAEKWRASNDPMYLQHSGDFRRMVDKLKKKAADDNLEACALVWLDVTMSCLECHEFVRSILIANGENKELDRLSLLTPPELRIRLADKSDIKTSVSSK